ncbi:MAG: putative exporter [Sulfurimonas sp.]|jgi:predicted exporter
MKYANYIILTLLLGLAFLLKEHINISTNLLSLFASEESIKKLNIASKLGYSKEMLISVKGFDNSSKTKLLELSKKLNMLNGIKRVQSTLTPSKMQLDYYKKNYPLLASFNDEIQNSQSIREKLQNSYNEMTTNIFYSNIDKNDPLKLFNLERKKTSLSHKGEYLALGEYGYLMRVSTDVSASDISKAKILYEEVNSILKEYSDVVAFAPFFYTVENSTKIKADVKWIIFLSSIVLILIYYILIKNIRLLSHTLLALFSSMVFATLVSTMLYPNFNVLSLAFGMSITAVSIDYLLHYYFHNFYQDKSIVDKNVLYGFLTTTVAFGIFSLIPIPIISQISFFAVLSLSFAYFLFTFIFKKLNISEYRQDVVISSNSKKLSSSTFFILSLMLISFSIYNLSLDNNIRNLDYQNTKLINTENFFKSSIKTNLKPVIIQAKSKDELMNNLHLLHYELPTSFSLASFVQDNESCEKRRKLLQNYDFSRLNTILNVEASKIGFRDSYFKDAYAFTKDIPKCKIPDLEIFNSYNLYIYNDKSTYYTMAFIDDMSKASIFSFVSDIDVKKMFSQQADKMYDDLALYSSLVITAVFILLFFSVKTKFLYALNYIIFPSSFVLAILSAIYTINLMHLFSLIILIAIGIDYGIYMSNTSKKSNTILAIRYSLLSTFAGFGVLAFSSIVALQSIGIVISLGVISIFILIRSQK